MLTFVNFYCQAQLQLQLQLSWKLRWLYSQLPQPASHPPIRTSTEWTLLQLLTLTTTSTITFNLTELGTAQPQLVFIYISANIQTGDNKCLVDGVILAQRYKPSLANPHFLTENKSVSGESYSVCYLSNCQKMSGFHDRKSSHLFIAWTGTHRIQLQCSSNNILQIGFGQALLLCPFIFLVSFLCIIPLYINTKLHTLETILVRYFKVSLSYIMLPASSAEGPRSPPATRHRLHNPKWLLGHP